MLMCKDGHMVGTLTCLGGTGGHTVGMLSWLGDTRGPWSF